MCFGFYTLGAILARVEGDARLGGGARGAVLARRRLGGLGRCFPSPPGGEMPIASPLLRAAECLLLPLSSALTCPIASPLLLPQNSSGRSSKPGD